jgi:sugar phosphate permease
LTSLPLLFTDAYGMSPRRIGVFLTLIPITGSAVASQYGRLARRASAPLLIGIGFIGYGLGLAGAGIVSSPSLIALALLSYGVGFGMVFPSIDTTLVSIVSDDLRAGVMSVRTSVMRVDHTAGPIVFTVAAETAFGSPTTGYRMLLGLSGGVIAVLGLIVGYISTR